MVSKIWCVHQYIIIEAPCICMHCYCTHVHLAVYKMVHIGGYYYYVSDSKTLQSIAIINTHTHMCV